MTSGRDTSTNSTSTSGGSSSNNNTSGGGSRLSRISFRPRPIDVTKKMDIIRDVIDDDQNGMTLMPILPTGMEPQEEEESHLQEIIQASTRVRHDQLPEIPIPVVKVVEGYDTESNPHPYHHANSTYIIHQDKTDQELDHTVEYDLDSEDEDLVNAINTSYKKSQTSSGTSKKTLLSMDRFESIIDRFEKELYYYGACDQAKADTICKGIKQSYVNQIYQHWVNKRQSWKNTMIRRLLRPPDREDPSPYKAFRPREENPNKQKKVRKNDSQSLQKMQQLRQEFERARTLLEMMKKRERLKKDQIVIYQQLYEQLLELAQIRSAEEDLSMPSTINTSSSNNQIKKKKDSSLSSSSNNTNINSSNNTIPTVVSSYLANHNYPGPAFNSIGGQQVLSNGKARQEGYRHYVARAGQFPTPTIDKQYSNILGLNTTSPLSKPVGCESISSAGSNSNTLSPISLLDNSNNNNLQQSSQVPSSSQQSSTSLSSQQQVVPISIVNNVDKEKRENFNDYFNSISIPTCSTYYDDDEYNDSDDSDNEDVGSTSNHRSSTTSTDLIVASTTQSFSNSGTSTTPTSTTNGMFYDPNIIPQPKLNPNGKPIYPSFNQGYIFLDPNHPPVLGKVRAGRYGGTYIDFLPIEKTNSFLFYQNQLKLFNQKLQNEQDFILKQQQQNNNYNNNNNNNNNLQSNNNLQLPNSPLHSTSHLNSPIDTQCNNKNNIIDDTNNILPITTTTTPTNTNDIVMEPITTITNNDDITNNIDKVINDDDNNQSQSNINSLKRKLNSSSGVESSPTKKLLITDFDGFTPIPSNVGENSNNNHHSSSNGNINGITNHSPSLTKSLKYSTKSNKNRHSTNNNSPTIEQYFTKKLSPTT